MLVRDVMRKDIVTVREDDSVGHLCEVLQAAHVNGVPVVGEGAELVGIVTEEDVLYGRMGRPADGAGNVPDDASGEEGVAKVFAHPSNDRAVEPAVASGPVSAPAVPADGEPRVRDIMTAPPVCASEETSVLDLCRIMWRLRIHRVPIVRGGQITGIVSTMDLVKAISEGRIKA